MTQTSGTRTTAEGSTRQTSRVKSAPPVAAPPVQWTPDGALAPLLDSLGSDFTYSTLYRHMALLGDGRRSPSANALRRSRIALRLQRDYGNAYVRRLFDGMQRAPATLAGASLDLVQRQADDPGLEPAPRVEFPEEVGWRQATVRVSWTANLEDFKERLVLAAAASMGMPEDAPQQALGPWAEWLYDQLDREDSVVRVRVELLYDPSTSTVSGAKVELAPAEPIPLPVALPEGAAADSEAPREVKGLPPGTTPELLRQQIQSVRDELARGVAEQQAATSWLGQFTAAFDAQIAPDIRGWHRANKPHLVKAEGYLAEDPPNLFWTNYKIEEAKTALSRQREDWEKYKRSYDFGAEVIRPVAWKALELASMGMVDESLFKESMEAAERGFAFQMAMVTRELAERLFALVTLGGGPAGAEAAMDYWLDNPGQDPMSRLTGAFVMYTVEGGIAIAEALLPIQELIIIFGIGEELDASGWEKADAVFNTLLKCALLAGGVKAAKGKPKAKPQQTVGEAMASKGKGAATAEAILCGEAELAAKMARSEMEGAGAEAAIPPARTPPERLPSSDVAKGASKIPEEVQDVAAKKVFEREFKKEQAAIEARRRAQHLGKLREFGGEGLDMPTALPPRRFVEVPELTERLGGIHKGKVVLEDTATGQRYIFKAAAKEAAGTFGEAADIPAGEQYRRAAGSAKVAKEVGIPAPETHVVNYKGQIGSLQVYITERWPGQVKPLAEIMKEDPALYKKIKESQPYKDQSIFEYLIADMDAHANNLLVELTKEGKVAKLHSIDMDFTLPPSELRNVVGGKPFGDFQKPLPKTVSPRTAELLEHMARNRATLKRVLSAYLKEAEVEGMLTRLDQILAKIDRGEIKVQDTSAAGPKPGNEAKSSQTNETQ